jgi:transcription elongation GreA/GreB family factor
MPKEYTWETGILLNAVSFPKVEVPYQSALETSDYDAVELLVMEKIDNCAADLAVFLPAYKSLVKKHETERALTLVQLHLDSLIASGETASLVQLAQTLLGFWPDCSPARMVLLNHIRLLYKKSPNIEKVARMLNVANCTGTDILRQFERWARYDEGRAVYMSTKGVGRVKEVNLALGVVRIVFNHTDLMSCKIDEAERLCLSLPQGHFLVKKLDSLKELQELAQNDPSALLALLFSSVKTTLSLAEVKTMLGGIISDDKWTSWWSRARKDNRLLVGSGTKPDVSWSDSLDAALAEVKKQFDAAATLDKLDMFQKFGSRTTDFTAYMVDALVVIANKNLESQPSLALEIIFRLDKAIKDGTVAVAFDSDEILKQKEVFLSIDGITDRLARRKAILRIKDVRDDWTDLYGKFLSTESDVQIISIIYETLQTKGNRELLDQLVSKTLAEPLSSPRFFLWLCKEMPSRPELKSKATVVFLLPLLRILDHKLFKGMHPALRKLFDLGEAADWAVAALSSDDAARVLTELTHDNGLEDYRKERIRQEIYTLYPQLHEKKIVLTYVTKDALEIKRTELQKIVREDLPHNSLEIQRTREYGDLRENFEYHAARARQEMLSSRAKSLHDELNTTRAIDPNTVDVSKISIGTRVLLKEQGGSGESIEIMVLGPWDSDPAKNILSYTSVAGEAMLYAKVGSEVAYNERKWVIEKIAVWCR